jgi:hypothetical protein
MVAAKMKKRVVVLCALVPILLIGSYLGFCLMYWSVRAFFDPLGSLKISEQFNKLSTSQLLSRLHSIDPISIYPQIAMEVLAERKDRAAVPALIRCTKSWNPDIRYQAIRALGNIGDIRAAEPLMEILRERKQKRDLSYGGALFSLAQIGYEPIRPIAIELLIKPDGARNGATSLMEYIGKKEDLPILEAMSLKIINNDVNSRLDRSGIQKAITAIKRREGIK